MVCPPSITIWPSLLERAGMGVGATDIITILFTDIVGSTEAVARLGEERAEQLRQTHFGVLREGIGEHAGTEVKNLGDGLMVGFGAASDAVACAVAMQQALERHNRRGGRAAGHAGRCGCGRGHPRGSDYFGTPVIEASRLCAKAEGGQILVTEMARALTGSRGGHRSSRWARWSSRACPTRCPCIRSAGRPLADAPAPCRRLAVDRSRPFIGRAGEREVLERAWKAAAAGSTPGGVRGR